MKYLKFVSSSTFIFFSLYGMGNSVTFKDSFFQKVRTLAGTQGKSTGLKELIAPSRTIHTLLNNPQVPLYEIQRQVMAGESINNPDKQGNTPLMRAIVLQRPDLVTYFAQKGARIDIKNSKGETAVDLMLASSQKETLLPLLEKAYVLTPTELMRQAILNNQYEIVRYLLERYPEQFGSLQENLQLLQAYRGDQGTLKTLIYDRLIEFFYTKDSLKIVFIRLIPFDWNTLAEELMASLPLLNKSLLSGSFLDFERILALFDLMKKDNFSLVPFAFQYAKKTGVKEPLFKALSFEQLYYGPIHETKNFFESYFRNDFQFQKWLLTIVKKMLDTNNTQLFNVLVLIDYDFNQLAFDLVTWNKLEDLEKLLQFVESEFLLLARHAKTHVSLFDYALNTGKEKIALWLMKKGIWDSNQLQTIFIKACRLGMKQLVKEFLQSTEQQALTPVVFQEAFSQAVEAGNAGTLELLIRHPLKKYISFYEMFNKALSLLTESIQRYKPVLEIILKENPSMINSTKSKEGNTFLLTALQNKHYALAEALIELGAHNIPNDEGITPLGLLNIQEGFAVERLRRMLEAEGAQITAQDAALIGGKTLQEFKEKELPQMTRRFKSFYTDLVDLIGFNR